MNLVVIDDFYSQPETVRQLALKADYKNVTQLNYPGYQSLKTFMSQDLVQKFSDVLCRSVDIDPARHTFGKFRIMLKETGSRLKVHLDGHSEWTGVLYLNPNEQCDGGTAFYRHKRTGLTGRASESEIKKMGYKNWFDLERSIIEPDSLDAQAWEETMFIGMKFNRLVLFKGNELFHCHTKSFGTDKFDGRMTQNFFFNEGKL